MKKLLSIVLAVAMMATMAFSASAAETVDLIKAAEEAEKIGANDAAGSTVTKLDDGSYEIVVTKDWGGVDNDVAYGAAIETWMSDVDLTGTPYIQLSLTSDVPFRITLLDKNAAGDQKWITFGSEFFNTVVADGSEAPSAAPENNFFPAGTYNCAAFLKGYYEWQANNGGTGFDPTAANLTAFYIELQNAGTLKLSKLTLAETDGTEGGDEGGDNSGDTTTTTATKPAPGGADDNKTSAKTGDTSNAVLFVVVAAVAVGVVTLSAVASKKAKSR